MIHSVSHCNIGMFFMRDLCVHAYFKSVIFFMRLITAIYWLDRTMLLQNCFSVYCMRQTFIVRSTVCVKYVPFSLLYVLNICLRVDCICQKHLPSCASNMCWWTVLAHESFHLLYAPKAPVFICLWNLKFTWVSRISTTQV